MALPKHHSRCKSLDKQKLRITLLETDLCSLPLTLTAGCKGQFQVGNLSVKLGNRKLTTNPR